MDNKSKNIIVVLSSLVGVLLLALVGLLAYNYGKDKGSEDTDSKETTTHVIDTVVVESKTTSLTSPAPVKTYESMVHGDLYGTVGGDYGQYVSPFMINRDGSGYYETGGARRTLRVVSRGNGYMEVKAYLRGKYIGKFKGTYSADGEYLSSYDGTFYSVRGGGLSFSLYNPHD